MPRRLTVQQGLVSTSERYVVGKRYRRGPMHPNRISRCLIGLLVAASVCLGSPALHAQADPATAANAAKLGQLLKETGLSYTKHSDTAWSVDLQRKNIGKVRVITSTGSDVIVTFVILAKKAAIQKTLRLLDTLASANQV